VLGIATTVERVMHSLVWLGLAHGLWLGLAAPALVALALRMRSDLPMSARHKLFLGAFLFATIGPFVTAMVHREAMRRSVRSPVQAAPPALKPMAGVTVLPATFPESPSYGPLKPDLRERIVRLASAVRPWILPLWITGLCGLAGMVLVGLGFSRRFLRQCRPAPALVVYESRRLARRLGLRRNPAVLVHDKQVEPCLCGVLRPSVVLPAGWLAVAQPRLVASVLAHELAHARCLDPLANVVSRFLEALVLFHPGARRLSRALRLQREFRADALAVRITGDARALAEALEGFARAQLARPVIRPLKTALRGESFSLLPRIQEILDMKSEPVRIGRWPVVALLISGMLAFVVATSGFALEEPRMENGNGKSIKAAMPQKRMPSSSRSEVTYKLGTIKMKGHERLSPTTGREVSYEVAMLEVAIDQSEKIDFDHGKAGKSLRIAYLSDLERWLLLSGPVWILQAPKVTAFEGDTANFRFPCTPGSDIDKKKSSNNLDITGEYDGKYIRLKIRFSLGNLDQPAQDPNQLDVRETTCTLPNGGSLIMSTDFPEAQVGRDRKRLFVVTPRAIPTTSPNARNTAPKPERSHVQPHP